MTNRSLLYITLILLGTTLVFSQKQHTLEDHQELHAILTESLKDNESAKTHLREMMSMISMRKSDGYVSVTNIDSNIQILKGELDKDQVSDDIQFETDNRRIKNAIQDEENQITELKKTRQLWKDRITGYNAELKTIEKIYRSDRDQYLQRVSKQSELINVLTELIEQSTTGLLENPNVPDFDLEGSGVQTLLAQMKEIGHGHPIEALVQLNTLFSKTDAQNIIQRFEALKSAIEESQKIDQQKEDRNLALFNVLTNNIENVLIPQAEEQIKQINVQIKQHRARIAELEEELRKITEIYNFRKDERSRAISYTVTASTTLQAELADLVQNEITVRNQ